MIDSDFEKGHFLKSVSGLKRRQGWRAAAQQSETETNKLVVQPQAREAARSAQVKERQAVKAVQQQQELQEINLGLGGRNISEKRNQLLGEFFSFDELFCSQVLV